MRSLFELQSLVDWLEKQPSDTSYNYFSTHQCLMAQYLQAVTGSKRPEAEYIFSSVFGMGTYLEIALKEPWTFGAALARAKALL